MARSHHPDTRLVFLKTYQLSQQRKIIKPTISKFLKIYSVRKYQFCDIKNYIVITVTLHVPKLYQTNCKCDMLFYVPFLIRGEALVTEMGRSLEHLRRRRKGMARSHHPDTRLVFLKTYQLSQQRKIIKPTISKFLKIYSVRKYQFCDIKNYIVITVTLHVTKLYQTNCKCDMLFYVPFLIRGEALVTEMGRSLEHLRRRRKGMARSHHPDTRLVF